MKQINKTLYVFVMSTLACYAVAKLFDITGDGKDFLAAIPFIVTLCYGIISYLERENEGDWYQ